MDIAKRKFLRATLLGAGAVGLRAFATGLPLGLFTHPHLARADGSDAAPACGQPQYLILSTSGRGDPLNANVPGTFVDGVYHPDPMMFPEMAPVAMNLGGTMVNGAKAWADLGPEILGRTSFVHHGTYTNSHGDAPKVNAYMGEIQRQEMLVSLLAKSLSTCLGPGGDAGVGGTVQPQPVVLSGNLITYAGAVLPPLNPLSLKQVLLGAGPLLTENLVSMRDLSLDKLNNMFKATGNTAQRALLDRYANSQTQVRDINQNILGDLMSITGSTRNDYNLAASILLRMNITPVVVMSYSFGDDNHGDTNLQNEATQTLASTQAISSLYALLKSSGLADKTTILFQNVFGRTLNVASHSMNEDGRNHNANHHCTVVIGSRIKSSVIGGIELNSSSTDFQATGFVSTTGASSDSGDIPYTDTLGSVGKTIGMAVGVDQTTLDTQITQGKVIPAMLTDS